MRGGCWPSKRSILMAVLLLGLFLNAPIVFAGNDTAYPCTASSPPIALGDVTVSYGTAPGSLLGSSASVTVVFDCTLAFSQNYNPGGVLKAQNFNSVTVQAGALAGLDRTYDSPGGGYIVFATSLAGIGLKLTAAPNQASSGSGDPNGTPGWTVGTMTAPSKTLSATFTAQLIKTGTVTPGTISGVTLAQFSDYNPGSTLPSSSFASLSLAPGTNVKVPTCTVDSSSQAFTVTLPTLSTASLQGAGAVAGRTRFPINLNCDAGAQVIVSMSSSNADPYITGVIDPTAGGASGVGVQVLNQQLVAVSVTGSPQQSITATGNMTIPYFAQYYQMGSAVSAGNVSATVTFTLSYQ